MGEKRPRVEDPAQTVPDAVAENPAWREAVHEMLAKVSEDEEYQAPRQPDPDVAHWERDIHRPKGSLIRVVPDPAGATPAPTRREIEERERAAEQAQRAQVPDASKAPGSKRTGSTTWVLLGFIAALAGGASVAAFLVFLYMLLS